MAAPTTFDPIRAIRASWIPILVLALIGGALLAELSARRPIEYTSRSTLLFAPSDPTNPNGGGTVSSTDIATALNTQAGVVLSDDVVRPAADQLHVTPLSLRKHLSVTPSTDSSILTVAGRSGTATGAQALTLAVVTAYTAADKARAVKLLQAQITAVTASVDATTKRLRQVNGLGAGAEATRGQLTGQLSTLSTQEQQLQTAAALYSGQVTVLTAAVLPTSPSSSGPVKSGVEGALLGAALGLLIGLYRQWAKMNRAIPEPQPVRAAAIQRRPPMGYEPQAVRRP